MGERSDGARRRSGASEGDTGGVGVPKESPHRRGLLRYDHRVVIVTGQRIQNLRLGQPGLLLGLLLLAHLGAMAFSAHGEMVAPVERVMAELVGAGPAERLAEPPMACSGNSGDCMLAWRLPGSLMALHGEVAPSSQADLIDLLDAGHPAPLTSPPRGPPRWASLQVLLQVFRI